MTFTNTATPGAPVEVLWYYGNDTFGFKEALVTFDKENGKVARLRLDTGGGYNILSRESESGK